MQTGAKAVGCYKCGKTGHWSRDCTAPQSEWVNRQAVPGQNGSQAAQAPADRPDQTPAPLEALPQKKKRAVKPKLTFDVLQRPKDGLPVVFLTFADRFRKRFRGRGHEGSDLRRLLEMYERWQHNLFPSMKFDDFLAGVEKIGRTSEVKKELRELRMGAIRLLDEEEAPEADTNEEPQAGGVVAEGMGATGSAAPSEDRVANARGPAQDTNEEDDAIGEDEFAAVGENGDDEGAYMEDELMDELMEDFEAHPTPQADTAEPDSVAEGSKTGRKGSDEGIPGPSTRTGQPEERRPISPGSAQPEPSGLTPSNGNRDMAGSSRSDTPEDDIAAPLRDSNALELPAEDASPGVRPNAGGSKRQRIDSDSD